MAYYHVVSTELLGFDCRSYCGHSDRIEGNCWENVQGEPKGKKIGQAISAIQVRPGPLWRLVQDFSHQKSFAKGEKKNLRALENCPTPALSPVNKIMVRS